MADKYVVHEIERFWDWDCFGGLFGESFAAAKDVEEATCLDCDYFAAGQCALYDVMVRGSDPACIDFNNCW